MVPMLVTLKACETVAPMAHHLVWNLVEVKESYLVTMMGPSMVIEMDYHSAITMVLYSAVKKVQVKDTLMAISLGNNLADQMVVD